jgi:hypothetical protein
VLARLRRDAPTSQTTRYYSAALLFRQGRPDLALEEVEVVVRENRRHALAQNLLGAVLASLGQLERTAFEASLRANPLSPGADLRALFDESSDLAVNSSDFAHTHLFHGNASVGSFA